MMNISIFSFRHKNFYPSGFSDQSRLLYNFILKNSTYFSLTIYSDVQFITACYRPKSPIEKIASHLQMTTMHHLVEILSLDHFSCYVQIFPQMIPVHLIMLECNILQK